MPGDLHRRLRLIEHARANATHTPSPRDIRATLDWLNAHPDIDAELAGLSRAFLMLASRQDMTPEQRMRTPEAQAFAAAYDAAMRQMDSEGGGYVDTR